MHGLARYAEIQRAGKRGGAVHDAEGVVARAAEDLIVASNVILSEYTGAHIHLQHISSKFSIDVIRRAKARGAHIYGEIAGYGSTCEAYHRVRLEECGEEPARAIGMCLKEGAAPIKTEREPENVCRVFL